MPESRGAGKAAKEELSVSGLNVIGGKSQFPPGMLAKNDFKPSPWVKGRSSIVSFLGETVVVSAGGTID